MFYKLNTVIPGSVTCKLVKRVFFSVFVEYFTSRNSDF